MLKNATKNNQSIVLARWRLLKWCALINALLSLLLPLIFFWSFSSYWIAFLWGGVGGCLYTLSMINVGSSTSGNELINSTSVLVLAYTIGGVLSPLLGGLILDISPKIGIILLFMSASFLGLYSVFSLKSR
jgi:fucose permease